MSPAPHARPVPDPVGPGQESVWNYPRPPRLESTTQRLVVMVGGVTVADSVRGYRVLETSQAPAFYIPPDDIDRTLLRSAPGSSFCEWKGQAEYWTVVAGGVVAESAGWSYASPVPAFAGIADHLSFYPGRVDGCFVDGERVQCMDGDFYGGWITSAVAGPFKGAPGTLHW